MIKRLAFCFGLIGVLQFLSDGAALAHGDVAHQKDAVVAGLVHPFLGLDHISALFLAGVIARLAATRRLLIVPAMVLAVIAATHVYSVPTAASTIEFTIGFLIAGIGIGTFGYLSLVGAVGLTGYARRAIERRRGGRGLGPAQAIE